MWGEKEFLHPLEIFDVGEEESIPMWFASMQLMLCSALLAVLTVAKRQRGERYVLHWGVLSIIFLLLSLDEVATIHEEAGAILERLLYDTTGFVPGGAISFFWAVPGTAFVLVVVLAYVGFLLHLPRSTRHLFLFAGALFVLGALGMEMLSAEVVSASDRIANWVMSASGGMIDRGTANAIPKILKGLQTDLEEMFECWASQHSSTCCWHTCAPTSKT